MSVNFNAWMARGVRPIDSSSRAVDIWRRIQRNPARDDAGELGIVFTKPRVNDGVGNITPATDLPRQIVRIEADNRATPVEGAAGAAPNRAVVIYGVIGHPDDAVADTDLAVGYEARIDGKQYRVTQVWHVPGGVQAQARVIG